MAFNLGDIEHAAQRLLLGTRCFAVAGAATGTTPAKCKTVNTVQYSVDGKAATKAGTDDLWTLSGVTIPASSTGYFLLCLNAAGTASVIQGAILTTATGAYAASSPVKGGEGYHGTITNTNGVATVCPIAELKVVTNATGTFVPGTTSLAVANTVDSATYTDLSCLPTSGKGA